MVIDDSSEQLYISLSGTFTHFTLSRTWNKLTRLVETVKAPKVVLDAADIHYCDGAGIALLSSLAAAAKAKKASAEIINLPEPFRPLLDAVMNFAAPQEKAPPPEHINLIEYLGKFTSELISDVFSQVAFWGQCLMSSLWLIRHPKKFRLYDFFHITQLAGTNALGLIGLLGFLFGLILAFSSAMPLRQFGVEIYVADLVAIGLVRVLGPFITAVIVAGRNGSAFAAEIGTMKINNEIDALEVMNLNPMAFLVVPRVLATMLVTPLLTLGANLMGMVGCGLVIMSLGYPFITYSQHVQSILTTTDVSVGLIKALVYGTLIGGIGCLRGFQTKIGAGAVGISTTRAVVTAIIILVITEGIFSVLLYLLDL